MKDEIFDLPSVHIKNNIMFSIIAITMQLLRHQRICVHWTAELI